MSLQTKCLETRFENDNISAHLQIKWNLIPKGGSSLNQVWAQATLDTVSKVGYHASMGRP